MNDELDFSNFSTKTDLKKLTGIDTPSFAKNVNLTKLKSDVGKLDIDKLKDVPINLNNFKSKLHKLDVDKLIPFHVNLCQLIHVVKNDIFLRKRKMFLMLR